MDASTKDAGMDAGRDAMSENEAGPDRDATLREDGSSPEDAGESDMDGGVDAGDGGLDAGPDWLPATVTSLASGVTHSCLTADGRLFCWGDNEQGKIGDGTTTNAATPVQIDPTHQWSQVCTGEHHSCALTAGAAYCWGDNLEGQLGVGDALDRLTPTAVATAEGPWLEIACQGDFTCARDDVGSIFCWGDNYAEIVLVGNVGINYPAPTQLVGGSSFSALRAGQGHACALRGGAAYCWGRNTQGQIGQGYAAGNVPPMALVGANTDWIGISPGQKHTCGLRQNTSLTTLWCWGGVGTGTDGSVDGEVGLGDGVTATTPQQVGTASNWREVVTASRPQACAITQAGELYCWGNAEDGQLGYATWDPSDVTNHDRSTPTRVGIESDWVRIAPGGHHTCGLRAGNQLYCWGKDEFEQLGNGPAGPLRVYEPERTRLPEPN